jgi:hypothetical protein
VELDGKVGSLRWTTPNRVALDLPTSIVRRIEHGEAAPSRPIDAGPQRLIQIIRDRKHARILGSKTVRDGSLAP